MVFSGRAAFFDRKRTNGIVPLRFIPQQTLLRRLAPQGGMGFGDHLRRRPDYGRSRDHRGTAGDIERQRKILCFRPFLPSLRGCLGPDGRIRRFAVPQAGRPRSFDVSERPPDRLGQPHGKTLRIHLRTQPGIDRRPGDRAPAEDSGYAAGSASNAKTAEPSKFGTG